MGIFDKIKELVNNKSLSISDIEKEIGVSNGTISKWNTSMPKADSLFKVAQILEVSIEYFLTEKVSECGTSFVEQNNINITDSFSLDEREVIINYQNLDARGKHKIHTTIYEELDRMAASAQEQRELNEIFKLASSPNVRSENNKSSPNSASLFVPAGKKD